ncbi:MULTISPECIES: hypothetical protein [unclassified Rhizobium]|uniref:hypothetical protein n=1 Tax=unclassified Rhizobium TaxID=2613769 RepID=UPI001AD98F4D|nr:MULTISPECIES: hypothetical protein [unclassified Rhizobium]MBO9126929.1 hypothetical protein [Rhizobium sp. 16-488-2b]MBO9177377.1 hypothetical protein [Rhizobium sp. 16-488-2a]
MRLPWRMIIRTLKERPSAEARPAVAAAILEIAGFPLKLREARRSLFLLTKAASEGRPAIVETEVGFVCLIGLDDLVEAIVEPGPTLKEVMEDAGVTRRPRRKVSSSRGIRPPPKPSS